MHVKSVLLCYWPSTDIQNMYSTQLLVQSFSLSLLLSVKKKKRHSAYLNGMEGGGEPLWTATLHYHLRKTVRRVRSIVDKQESVRYLPANKQKSSHTHTETKGHIKPRLMSSLLRIRYNFKTLMVQRKLLPIQITIIPLLSAYPVGMMLLLMATHFIFLPSPSPTQPLSLRHNFSLGQ